MTNEQVRSAFDVRWDGAHGGLDCDLLNVLDHPRRQLVAEPLEEAIPSMGQRDFWPERQVVAGLLATQRVWKTKALLAASGLDQGIFWNCLQYLQRHGRTTSPGRGVVARVGAA